MSGAANRGSAYAVVIAGGGLVGGSLAIGLARAGIKVALVEAVPPESDQQPSFDDRTIALSRGSYRILAQLGIWDLLATSVWPIRKIHVSEQRRFGTAVIDAHEQDIPELGFVIKSRALGQALWQCMRELPEIDIFCPARVTATELSAGQRVVVLDDGTQLTTGLLAIADGARSALRAAVGIEAVSREYGQTAIVSNVQVDAEHAGDIAYERFTAEGPLAMLPGADGNFTCVLARATEHADAVCDLGEQAFLELVQKAFGFRLGRLRQAGARQAYPLSLVAAEQVTAVRAVIVGSAAHGLHPVAAQGFNLGLRDVASLAELIADNARDASEVADADADADADAGAVELLAAYSDWRAIDQRNVVRFTDSLIRCFDLPGELTGVGRGLALAAFDMLPGAKQELARHTMGLSGRLSRLGRGLPL